MPTSDQVEGASVNQATKHNTTSLRAKKQSLNSFHPYIIVCTGFPHTISLVPQTD